MFEVLEELFVVFKKEERDKILIRSTIFILLVTGTLGGCHMINQKVGLEDDNILEERIEEKIKEETGFDVDLTPNSKEALS